MLTVKLEITIKEMPANGEVHIISSFNPNFWKTQPKTIKKIVTQNSYYQFQSTNEIWIITRCVPYPCEKGADGKAAFKFEYKRFTDAVEEETVVSWSLYITICLGFSMMFIALMYFEWRTIFRCINRCKENMCGKSSQR